MLGTQQKVHLAMNGKYRYMCVSMYVFLETVCETKLALHTYMCAYIYMDAILRSSVMLGEKAHSCQIAAFACISLYSYFKSVYLVTILEGLPAMNR